jgi:uncharacterized membrane protein YiaA
MERFKQSLNVLALILGIVGFVGCIAAIVGVWIGCARLSQTTENLFGKIDQTFIVVRERISRTTERVQKSKITTESIEQALRDWSKREASQRLASLPAIKEKAERLAGIMEQADHLLELSASSTEVAQDILSMGTATGAPMTTEPADRLLEEIGALRSQLAQARELVERIGGLTAEAREEKILEERIYQCVKLSLRLVATLSSLDTQLEKIEGKVSDIQEKVHSFETKTLRRILLISICISLVIAWMATGQVFLCLHGWKSLSEGRTRHPSNE